MDIETADPPISDVERLYRDQGKRLWWALLGYSGDPEVASDAVAEAFAQLIRRGDAVRSPAKWLWRAAFNIATAELGQRSEVRPAGIQESYEMDEPSDVLAALACLSPRQRAAVLLHHYAGYSLREIGSILGSSPATVGVHLTRGRRRLREILEAEQ